MVGYNLRLHDPSSELVAWSHSGQLGAGRRGPAVVRQLAARLAARRSTTAPRTRPAAELGGGVLNDAIHELDLAVWLCGADLPAGRRAWSDRFGPLEIDVEDTVSALLVDRAPARRSPSSSTT